MKSGTILTCPDCATEQIETTQDVPPGGQMKDAGFKSLGFDLNNHRAGCYRCGTEWVRKHPITKETQIHTKDKGWVSLVKTPGAISKSKIIPSTMH